MLPGPINVFKWIAENEDKLRPPVNNFCLQQGKDFFLMIVGGPNERSDYHINETEVGLRREVLDPYLVGVVLPGQRKHAPKSGR